jgi:hypothetical protein
MVRFTIAILALIAAILVLAARHGTLHALKVANESLRERMDSEAPAAAPPEKPRADAGLLNADESAELLRLRGQILPLNQELRDLSNRLERAAALSSTTQARIGRTNLQRSEISQEQRARMQAMEALFRSEPVQTLYRNAALAGQKLQKYMRENNNELPQDVSLFDGLPEGFELMRSGSVSEGEQGRILVARQKEPLQTPDGKMLRVYVRANGTALVATLPPNGDWAEWEHGRELGVGP